jgi:hypothetical protein
LTKVKLSFITTNPSISGVATLIFVLLDLFNKSINKNTEFSQVRRENSVLNLAVRMKGSFILERLPLKGVNPPKTSAPQLWTVVCGLKSIS